MVRDREEPDGRYILARGISPGTFQRLHVVKARLGCDSWGEFMGASLELVEKNLGAKG